MDENIPRETTVHGSDEPMERARITVAEPGMSTVGEVLAAVGFGDPGDWPACSICHGSFPVVIDGACAGCVSAMEQASALKAEVRRLADGMDRNLQRWLKRAGLSERELRAELRRVPERLQRELPASIVASMNSGIIPKHGFGLRGTAGTGKTFTLAALVANMAGVRIAGELPTLGRMAFRPWLTWCAWPELVNRLRVMASRDDGVSEGDDIMKHIAESEALVLDDLGAERWKAEDWVGSLLDLLVDARYKSERPTWYTTHLKPEEMQERYGARLFSRLTGDNPMIEVAGGRDLRIVK